MPEGMKRISRNSIADDFEVVNECPIPCTPKTGARIKVHYAGACYTSQQVKKSGQRRLRTPGVQDTSLFPGYEVAGIVDEICDSAGQTAFKKGDRIVVYPDENNESCVQDGVYADYITVSNLDNLIHVPESLSLDVASQLPCGALMAYATVVRIKPFMEVKLKSNDMINVLIIGAGGLGLWTLKLAKHFIGESKNVKTILADTSLEKLNVAKSDSKIEVIHWNESMYEQHMIERTQAVCKGGADVIIDYVSTPRTISRALKVLKEEGILLVGGTAKYEVSFCLNSLAQKNQTIIGVRNGTREQLHELVDAFASQQIGAPTFQVYPVEDATRVFGMLNECKINGRAVFKVSSDS